MFDLRRVAVSKAVVFALSVATGQVWRASPSCISQQSSPISLTPPLVFDPLVPFELSPVGPVMMAMIAYQHREFGSLAVRRQRGSPQGYGPLRERCTGMGCPGKDAVTSWGFGSACLPLRRARHDSSTPGCIGVGAVLGQGAWDHTPPTFGAVRGSARDSFGGGSGLGSLGRPPPCLSCALSQLCPIGVLIRLFLKARDGLLFALAAPPTSDGSALAQATARRGCYVYLTSEARTCNSANGVGHLGP